MTESAMDLTLKSPSSESESDGINTDNVPILRPIPRPPWSIIWYQNLWPSYRNHPPQQSTQQPFTSSKPLSHQNPTGESIINSHHQQREVDTPNDDQYNNSTTFNQHPSQKHFWRKCDDPEPRDFQYSPTIKQEDGEYLYTHTRFAQNLQVPLTV